MTVYGVLVSKISILPETGTKFFRAAFIVLISTPAVSAMPIAREMFCKLNLPTALHSNFSSAYIKEVLFAVSSRFLKSAIVTLFPANSSASFSPYFVVAGFC